MDPQLGVFLELSPTNAVAYCLLLPMPDDERLKRMEGMTFLLAAAGPRKLDATPTWEDELITPVHERADRT